MHAYLGIFVGLHFIVLGLSGSILLFKDELQGSPETPLVAENSLSFVWLPQIPVSV